ncbi:MAG: hypothetical protein JXA07_12320 [Spirochaetes bacterium]|nr:hypothetical protein [Spirochaetota bacterium]
MIRTKEGKSDSFFYLLGVVAAVVILTSSCLGSNNDIKSSALMMAGISRASGRHISIDEALPSSLSDITIEEINEAKSRLHIAYGHTSHGSQLITGMEAIARIKGSLYAFNNGGSGGALDLHDYAMGGDCGYYPEWVNNTRNYLGAPDPDTGRGSGTNADVNVIIWSWCGQVDDKTAATMISEYLAPMSVLENDYPGITFVYMTGHTEGTGLAGEVHIRNEQIRNYCRDNGKVLFDFESIESSDPSANYFGDKLVTDTCWYDSNGDGSRDANWATEWIAVNPGSELTVLAYPENCDACAHSERLNCIMKGVAAWMLWVEIAAAMP